MIKEFFKEHVNDDVRLYLGERWLVYNGQWIVYQHLQIKRNTTTEYEGDSLEEALEVLGEG